MRGRETTRFDQLDDFLVEFNKGDIVMKEGDPGRSFYMLLEGEASIRVGGKEIRRVSRPGSFLGEVSSLKGIPRTATVVAAADLKAFEIPAGEIRSVFKASPAIAERLVRSLVDAVAESSDYIRKSGG